MGSVKSQDYLVGLLTELRRLPAESGIVEFKENNANPDDIGEYISALSNMAALNGLPSAYVAWGIQDGTHEVTGTTFNPHLAKKGNENLENWLNRMLNPRIDFSFYSFEYEGKKVFSWKSLGQLGSPFSSAGLNLFGSARIARN